MPASSSSSTSCQRLGWREPGALRVRQLVDQDQRRAGAPARRRGRTRASVRAAVGRRSCSGKHVQALEQRRGLGAAVGLDDADHARRLPCGLQRARGRQHRVGLADAGGGAEEDLAACRARRAALLALHVRQQRVGVGAVGRRCRPWHQPYGLSVGLCASSARFSSSTFTRGSPRKPSWRPSVCRSTSAAHLLRRQACARAATRASLVLGGGQADVRVEAAGRGGDQVDRHRRGVVRVGGAQRRDPRLRRRRVSAGLGGPWLEPLEARGVVRHRAGGRRPAPEVLRVARTPGRSARADRLGRRARSGCRWPGRESDLRRCR